MPDYSLAAYTVRVRQRWAQASSENYLPLSDFDGVGSDLLQFVYAFCNSATTQPIRHKDQEKYLRVVNVRAQGRVVRSEIESGSHGFTARLVDVEDNTETYLRRVTDAELLPLRNLFALPLESPVGLFMTERLGVRGLKSSLVAAMNRSFAAIYSDFSLDISTLAPEEAVKTSLEEGELKGIKLVRYGIPRDLEERYNLGAHEEEVGTIELMLRPERGLPFPKKRLAKLLETGDRAGLLEVGGVEYDDIKLEVKIGKQRRTLTLTADRTPRVTFLLPGDCEVDEAGRPTDASFYAFAVQIARDLSRDIGLDFERLIGAEFKWTRDMRRRTVEVLDIED